MAYFSNGTEGDMDAGYVRGKGRDAMTISTADLLRDHWPEGCLNFIANKTGHYCDLGSTRIYLEEDNSLLKENRETISHVAHSWFMLLADRFRSGLLPSLITDDEYYKWEAIEDSARAWSEWGGI